MNWKAALRRLSNQVSAHEPPLVSRVRRKELARGRVLQAFLHALDVLTVPDALDREVGSVLAAYCDPLLVEGRIPLVFGDSRFSALATTRIPRALRFQPGADSVAFDLDDFAVSRR